MAASREHFPKQHELYAAGHGYGQKLGDEVAEAKGQKRAADSDEGRKFLAIKALHNRLTKSMDWNKVAEGGGSVSGASVVLKAIMEVSGKTLADVEADRTELGPVPRPTAAPGPALYASFRNPAHPLGPLSGPGSRARRQGSCGQCRSADGGNGRLVASRNTSYPFGGGF